jgi:flagellar biosynthesis protein FlhG
LARVNTDQAQGLRQLFAAEEVRVVALVGSQSQSVSAALALALTAQGKKVLLVDEELCAGEEHPLLNAPLTVDIGQVLRGKKELRDIMLSEVGITLMPADTVRIERSMEAARIHLIDEFHAFAVGFDYVVVHAAPDLQRHGMGFALAAPEVIVLCDQRENEITKAYRHIKTLTKMGGARHFMLMFRGGNEALAKVMFHKLTAVCQKYLRLKLDFSCVLPADSMAAAEMLEMLALDMMHWPAPSVDNGSRFDIFMCRLLNATGSSLAAVQ